MHKAYMELLNTLYGNKLSIHIDRIIARNGVKYLKENESYSLAIQNDGYAVAFDMRQSYETS